MNIAVNLRLYVHGKIGGLENYVRHVVGGVCAAYADAGHHVTVFAHENEVENVTAIAPDARIFPVIHETAQQVLHDELVRGAYDLLFCPLLVVDPLPPNTPSAVMIPDLQHEFFPEFFDSNTLNWRRQTYRPSTIHAGQIFTLSEHARKTIVDIFRTDPSKVQVIYLDVDSEFRAPHCGPPSKAFRSLELPEEYVFYPANFWAHKNHSTLLKAMRLVLAKHPDLHLVLTGSSDNVESVRKQVRDLGLEKRVLFPGYVDRTTLVEIYQNARALTFVSKFEGFGIPIVEAFHTGTPVLASRAASCPEIGADAALAVDETDPASIASGIDRLLSDDALRAQLTAAGHRRKNDFSWNKALDLTLQAFDRITRPPSVSRRIEVQEYPMVSVVTPSYNMGRFLRQTVDSVLHQDYPKVDYIVMDAGSSDDTVEILKSYGDRLRYHSAPDRGQADAVNKGFAISRGKVFTFLNADDTYLPGAVGAAVQHMMNNPTVGVVYGEANYVKEDGSLIGRYPTMPFDAQTLNRCCYICQPASFMWSDVFQTVGCMNADLQFALDYDLWIRISKLYPMMKVDDLLATSRMYRENKTLGKRHPVYMEILSTVKTHYEYIPFDWVFGYASFLLDRKDQFFEVSHPSLSKVALSLMLGSYYNRQQMMRYWREWGLHLGIGGTYEGRYGDNWISKRYITELELPEGCRTVSITGRHLAPFDDGLALTLNLNGTIRRKLRVDRHGPFAFQIDCPEALGGSRTKLKIEAARTFRPAVNGDYRKLSCIIDSIGPGTVA